MRNEELAHYLDEIIEVYALGSQKFARRLLKVLQAD